MIFQTQQQKDFMLGLLSGNIMVQGGIKGIEDLYVFSKAVNEAIISGEPPIIFDTDKHQKFVLSMLDSPLSIQGISDIQALYSFLQNVRIAECSNKEEGDQ